MTDDGSDDLLLDAARACRPYLASLVPADEVAAVDAARACCVQRNRAVCWCGGSAGHMARASSVNALARRSRGGSSVAIS
jgi:hypothetical protein